MVQAAKPRRAAFPFASVIRTIRLIVTRRSEAIHGWLDEESRRAGLKAPDPPEDEKRLQLRKGRSQTLILPFAFALIRGTLLR